MKKYINSFGFLRIFAFLNVFLLHTAWCRVTNIHISAGWAVSFFFMVSGFLYGYKYYKKENVKFKDTIKFFFKKLLKIYPLYIVTLIAFLPFSNILRMNTYNIEMHKWIKSFILNLTLTQSWVSDRTISYGFTGVGWFLSDFMFLTLITIPIVILVRRIFKGKTKLVLGMTIMLVLSAIYYKIIRTYNLDPIRWMYIFPPARLFEYIISIMLGMFFYETYNDKPKNIVQKTFFSLIEIAVFVGLFKCLTKIDSFQYLNKSIGWIIPNMILLFIFAKEYGLLSKFFGNKLFVHIGGLTFDAYLLHQVVNMYVYVVPFATYNLVFATKLKTILFILIMTFLIAEFNQPNSIFKKIETFFIKDKKL